MSQSSSDDFLYFDDLQSLASWRPESSLQHPHHISNTPLHPRPPSAPTPKIPTLLFTHDFKGSYLPEETPRGLFPPPTSPPSRPYTAEHLHLSTTFIYFSHKLTSVPPACWTNTCHRAGVRVLGTFLLEHQPPALAARILDRGSEGELLYASQLRRIARTYGFEGWLLNLEAAFPRAAWRPSALQEFIAEIRADGLDVVWYDALTVLNRVHYQNGLTLLNAPFLHAASGLFANYFWRAPDVRATAAMARAMRREQDVYMGVDVHGRGSLGGGGYGVGEALREVRGMGGAGVALFAPAWTWENFAGAQGFEEREARFWGVVREHVREGLAGTAEGLYTAFNRGFGAGWWVHGERVRDAPWTHLGAQDLLPTVPDAHRAHDGSTAWSGGWCIKLLPAAHNPRPLFATAISLRPNTALSLRWKGASHRWRAYAALTTGEKISRLLTADDDDHWHRCTIPLPAAGTVTELGLIDDSPPGADPATGALWIGEIKVAPEPARGDAAPSIVGARVYEPETRVVRWAVYHGDARRSGPTRDFAYFIVYHKGVMLGVAYCCEFKVPAEVQVGENERFRIQAVTWEGEVRDFE